MMSSIGGIVAKEYPKRRLMGDIMIHAKYVSPIILITTQIVP
jgi:hypothetical protein